MTVVVACALPAACALSACNAQEQSLPHHRKQGTATQLVMGGKPFLVLGGELCNSSSSLEHTRPIWPKPVALYLDTIAIPVYRVLMEPTGGRFEFSLVDGLTQEARQHNLRLAPSRFDIRRAKWCCSHEDSFTYQVTEKL